MNRGTNEQENKGTEEPAGVVSRYPALTMVGEAEEGEIIWFRFFF
jgi:hypothetical protein